MREAVSFMSSTSNAIAKKLVFFIFTIVNIISLYVILFLSFRQYSFIVFFSFNLCIYTTILTNKILFT
jgi:hypothetical protein